MVGFNPLNPSARDRVFSVTRETDVAIEVMFAVRRALSRPDELARVAAELVEQGRIDGADLDLDDPLGFLVHEGGAASVVEAAYRFARHEPGCHVVLTGTGQRRTPRGERALDQRAAAPRCRPRPAPYPVRTSRSSLGQLRRSPVPCATS